MMEEKYTQETLGASEFLSKNTMWNNPKLSWGDTAGRNVDSNYPRLRNALQPLCTLPF